MNKFRPVNQCFEKSDTIRANHLLWKDFQKERTDIVGMGVYKFVFYGWLMDNELKAKHGKDENGNLGYGLRFIEKQAESLAS